MTLFNPLVANLVVAPVDTTAAAPAISFGGDDAYSLSSSGTGIHGDYTEMHHSVGGADKLSITAAGGEITGDLEVSGKITLVTVQMLSGAGAPAAVAPKGSIYLRTDGADADEVLYVNTDGDDTWVALISA